MINPAAERLLNFVADSITDIDRSCSTLLNEIEHGLVNVKLEFREQAQQQLSKKLTEEQLIAWLIFNRATSAGATVAWEQRYPHSTRQKCDLVFALSDTEKLWLELKIAWKAWFNCVGGPVNYNGVYLSYLQGANRSHSFQQDFGKMNAGSWGPHDYRAICLVGFDKANNPMDSEVAAVAHPFEGAAEPWVPVAKRHWLDRRCLDFRMNVWTWCCSPTASLTAGA